ncbi:MAG: hypothetical protein U5K28_05435 [Halobacteriales archaeon]|nr:hypothetical protein [Halobacteriales archaeon]
MTVIAVLVDPPRPGLVLSELAETTPLSDQQCADLYAAMTRDVLRTVTTSGGDLLVNFRPDESLPETHSRGEGTAEAEIREIVSSVVDDARFEQQVGETFAGRAGNTASHLLDTEEVQSVGILTPEAVFTARQQVDAAAMKIRTTETVLGPTTDGRVYYAAFREGIDFQDAYDAPAVESLTDRTLDMGNEVAFLPYLPVVETTTDLVDAVTGIRTRQHADTRVPEATAAWLNDVGLFVDADGELQLDR